MSNYLARAGILAAVVVASACGGARSDTPENIPNPDRFLYDRGLEAIKNGRWLDAREYFRQVVDNYPQSPLRPEAKLGIGDAHYGEDSAESLVLAANEYREFLTFYPTNPRADYAQYRLAMTHFEQMKAPERDQTETQAAIAEFQVFFDRFSNPPSPLLPEVRQKWREARDRLSEASFRVGLHYYRIQWYPGAISRFREVLKVDPEYSGRDQVYYYLAESLARTQQVPEAIAYFDRLLTEFSESEHHEDARSRLAELKIEKPAAQ